MVFDWKRLGEEIGFVLVARFPENSELSFTYSVLDPMVAHSSGLELFNPNFFGSSFLGCGVVGAEGCVSLRISNIF